MNIPAISAKVLEVLITKSEQMELSLMLKLLSTGIGCYCTAGYPLPFQVSPLQGLPFSITLIITNPAISQCYLYLYQPTQSLPLHHRVKALEGWRDSPIGKLRVFYQVSKPLSPTSSLTSFMGFYSPFSRPYCRP